MPRWTIAIAIAAVAAPVTAADLPGDPVAGERLAGEVCAVCHTLERGGFSPLYEAPALPEYVDDVSVTALSLRVFLQTPHATMPDIPLSAAETDDLIAYLLTLRRR